MVEFIDVYCGIVFIILLGKEFEIVDNKVWIYDEGWIDVFDMVSIILEVLFFFYCDDYFYWCVSVIDNLRIE